MRFLAFDRHPGGIAQTRAASQLPRRLSSFARVSAAFVLAGVPKESPALLGAASLLLELPPSALVTSSISGPSNTLPQGPLLSSLTPRTDFRSDDRPHRAPVLRPLNALRGGGGAGKGRSLEQHGRQALSAVVGGSEQRGSEQRTARLKQLAATALVLSALVESTAP